MTDGAGVAGAEQRVGAAVTDRLGGDTNGSAGLRRSAAAADSAISTHSGASSDVDFERARDRVTRKLGVDHRADRRRAAGRSAGDARRDERAVNDAAGTVIAAHGVDGDAHSAAGG